MTRRTLLCATGVSPGVSGNEKSHNALLETEVPFQVPTVCLISCTTFPPPLHMESGLGDMTFIDGECKQV